MAISRDTVPGFQARNKSKRVMSHSEDLRWAQQGIPLGLCWAPGGMLLMCAFVHKSSLSDSGSLCLYVNYRTTHLVVGFVWWSIQQYHFVIVQLMEMMKDDLDVMSSTAGVEILWYFIWCYCVILKWFHSFEIWTAPGVGRLWEDICSLCLLQMACIEGNRFSPEEVVGDQSKY